MACFDKGACKEGDAEHTLNNCEEGYEGIMCATCSPGYWKPKSTYSCTECSFVGDSATSA